MNITESVILDSREFALKGTDLKTARLSAHWTQQKAASGLGLTQAYLSMVERGHRPVTSSFAARALNVLSLPPTALPFQPDDSVPLRDDDLKSDLGALGYPGFSYLRGKPARNPAQLLFYALDQPDLDARVVEALPWLTSTYVDMDWNWLVRNVKLNDRQNRLGFVAALAAELAKRSGDQVRLHKLTEHRTSLDRSRLVREDTLCHDSMTQAERKWLQHNRGPEARHWNLLTDLEVKHLAYAPA
jgi:transcriptional regulator with XRE-family HTH domain